MHVHNHCLPLPAFMSVWFIHTYTTLHSACAGSSLLCVMNILTVVNVPFILLGVKFSLSPPPLLPLQGLETVARK